MFERRKHLAWAFGLSLLLALAATSAVHAQRGRSWVNGLIFDESETHGVAGATVTLKGDPSSERLHGVTAEARADEDGKYYFKDLGYGEYTFQVTAPGFQPYEIHLFVAPDTLTALHVKLHKEEAKTAG